LRAPDRIFGSIHRGYEQKSAGELRNTFGKGECISASLTSRNRDLNDIPRSSTRTSLAHRRLKVGAHYPAYGPRVRPVYHQKDLRKMFFSTREKMFGAHYLGVRAVHAGTGAKSRPLVRPERLRARKGTALRTAAKLNITFSCLTLVSRVGTSLSVALSVRRRV
jgi:hypothetical protein